MLSLFVLHTTPKLFFLGNSLSQSLYDFYTKNQEVLFRIQWIRSQVIFVNFNVYIIVNAAEHYSLNILSKGIDWHSRNKDERRLCFQNECTSSARVEITVYRQLPFHPVTSTSFIQIENTRCQSWNETLFFQQAQFLQENGIGSFFFFFSASTSQHSNSHIIGGRFTI